MRVGYFPNVTHAQALTGQARGSFAKALPDLQLKFLAFNAGPSAMEALFANELDLSYVGPNPALNAFAKSQGRALRIVAGSAQGGAGLVVRPGARIERPEDLAGKRIAAPQIGGTQDIALRIYLIEHGLKSKEKGGTVTVTPLANPDILNLFRRGDLDGAWVPEPWLSRLLLEAGGKLFLDERDLWPDRKFATTLLVASTRALTEKREVVKRFIAAHVAETLFVQENQAEAQQLVNQQLAKVMGAPLPKELMAAAFSRVSFDFLPLKNAVEQSARNAQKVGFLPAGASFEGLYELSLLDEVLAAQQTQR